MFKLPVLDYHKSDLFVIILLLFISLIWRFAASATHVSFSQDAARDVWLTKQRAQNQEWIVSYGPKTSIGNFYLPPLYNQLHLGLALLTEHHPNTMKWFITVVESLTPVLIFLILKRIIKVKIAVLASLIYLFSSLPSIFGTTAWNPNMIPFLAMLTLYFAIGVLIDKRLPWIIGLCLAASFVMQLHFQAAVLLPFVIGVFFMSIIRQKSWMVVKYWLLGLLLSSVFVLPYFWAELNSNWQNSTQIIRFFTTEHTQYYDRVSKPDYLVLFFPKFMERVTFGSQTPKSVLGIGVYLFGFGSLIYLTIRKKSFPHFLLLYYFSSIILTLRFFKGDKLDYYLSLLFPMFVILLGIAVSLLKKEKVIAAILLAIIFVLGFKQSFWVASNDVVALQKIVQELENITPGTNIRLIFHDDDYANTIFYGINNYSKLIIDQSSQIVVDVCNPKDLCQWNGIVACQQSPVYTAVTEFKHNAEYQPLYSIKSNLFTLSIGQVMKPQEKFTYYQTNINANSGSDQLLEL